MRIEAQLPALAARLHQMASEAAPNETGGVLVVDRGLVAVGNRSPDPQNQFDFGSLGDLEETHGQLAAIFHTHPEDQPPSPADFVQCAATMLPWVIAGPRRLWVIHPEHQAYAGRSFAYGESDCFTLVSDFYAQERGIILPWFERPDPNWWHDPAAVNPYLANAQAIGFQLMPWAEVGTAGLQPGDVILMRVAAKQTNHAAIYMGGGNILHHLWGHLSNLELFDGRFQRFTTHIGRFRGLSPC